MASAPLAFTTPDAIVFVVMALFALRGAWKGFIRTLLRTAGLTAGFLLAARLDVTVGTFLADHLSFVPRSGSDIVGWVTVVVLTYALAAFVAHSVRGAIRDLRLRTADRLLGAVLGAALGLGICAFSFTLWASARPREEVRATLSGSSAAVWMARTVRSVTPLFPDGVRKRWLPVLSSLD